MRIKLILGDTCNLHCEYCYQENQNNRISKEVLDKIAFLIKDLDEIDINLFGGEPTLYEREIMYFLSIVDMNKVNFSISTNGTNQEVIRKIQSTLGKKISILLSNKKGIIPSMINDKTKFRYILTTENIKVFDRQYFEILHGLFREKITFIPNFYEKWRDVDILNLSIFKKNIDELTGRFNEIIFPCNNLKFDCCVDECIINWNGDILGCHRVKDSIIGNIFNDGLKLSKLEKCISLTQGVVSKNFSNSFVSHVIPRRCD